MAVNVRDELGTLQYFLEEAQRRMLEFATGSYPPTAKNFGRENHSVLNRIIRELIRVEDGLRTKDQALVAN